MREKRFLVLCEPRSLSAGTLNHFDIARASRDSIASAHTDGDLFPLSPMQPDADVDRIAFAFAIRHFDKFPFRFVVFSRAFGSHRISFAAALLLQ